jgi:hypothetical protein
MSGREHTIAYMIAQLPAVELIAGQAAFTTDTPLLNSK